MKLKACCNYFTLIEILAVISIILLFSAVLTATMMQLPIFFSFDEEANQLTTVFTTAAHQAVSSGKDVIVTVSYDPAEKILNANSMLGDPDQDGPTIRTSARCKEVDVTFEPEPDEEQARFYFYPDGSASGPAILMERAGHTFRLQVSKLTGMVSLKEVEQP